MVIYRDYGIGFLEEINKMIFKRKKRMANNNSVTWNGASGKGYIYWVYSIPASFNPRQNGNYIYTRIVNNMWIPLYIGQGDLSERTNIDNHHQSRCLKSKGATHVHVHLNDSEVDRTAEEKDLLAGHSEASQPTGCNEKPGG